MRRSLMGFFVLVALTISVCGLVPQQAKAAPGVDIGCLIWDTVFNSGVAYANVDVTVIYWNNNIGGNSTVTHNGNADAFGWFSYSYPLPGLNVNKPITITVRPHAGSGYTYVGGGNFYETTVSDPEITVPECDVS